METWRSKLEASGGVFRKFTGQFKAALGEVGTQLKHHASQATKEIGIDLDNINTPPFCKGINQVQCSLFSPPGSCASKRTSISVSGDYNFVFELKFHPHEIGVVICTVSNVKEQDCTFKWRRKHATYVVDIEHAKGPRYVLTADDIGNSIVVHCTPEGGLGTAIGEIGPFDVDVTSRRAIQDSLINSSARHDVYMERDAATIKTVTEVLRNPDITFCKDGSQVKYVMYIMAEEVQLQSDDDFKGDTILKCRYTSSFPRVRLCNHEPCRMFLTISDKHEVTLRMLSKQQRDMVALTLRAFHSRALILNSLETNSLEVLRDGKLQDVTSGGRHLNVIMALQKANDDLSVALDETTRLRKELSRCKQEKSFLESEMENTIRVFQQQLSEDDTQEPSKGHNKENYETLYTDLINRNAQLADQLAEITRERNNIEQELDTVRGERNRLDKHVQSVVKDLERLRFDNQCLEKQVEDLKAKVRKLASL
ncbi:hypothetical protein BBOV_III004830 [Babesia bovis T2Bo]|uniref:Uncharacterized protein n=1 Tax=Babesia bovis TaxID=5865 RepID=A7ANB2_BABBO|nr:hypothetical protein BBOV_III004830 [Babesia bovis T2Bo]EDO08046.1 hypothetical protein BBOV_III004830 [Babesia bovis T2Bo]|eukprot:XP_001611614.1 hypothetical protein [Babesia bovis T2Bo]